MDRIDAVTGAFGFSGQVIAEKLLEKGIQVRTLTNSPNRQSPLQGKVEVRSLNFNNKREIIDSLSGVTTLYNNYWVRFNCRDFDHDRAVRNSEILVEAAKEAGVRRLVHVSITNPDPSSRLSYFRGKAQVEQIVQDSGIPYAILRPAILYGPNDILVNNIAWMLRRFPIFLLIGRGKQLIQPVYVGDFAEIAVDAGMQHNNCILNAIGPETFEFRELVHCIRDALNESTQIMPFPKIFVYLLTRIGNGIMGDYILTWDEIEALNQNLLFVNDSPLGKTKFSDWIVENANRMGNRYSNELLRRTERNKGFDNL